MKIGDLVKSKWSVVEGIWIITEQVDEMSFKKYWLQNVATGEQCLLHYTNIEPLEAKWKYQNGI